MFDLRGTEMNQTITITADIPEALADCITEFLATHPLWDHDRTMTAALALFLLQNGENDRIASRIYLDTLFAYSGVSANATTAA